SLYDFRFPNATKMLFIAENDADGATYTINMPLSYEYMERSWAKWNDGGYCDFRIDGVQLTAIVNLGEYCIGPVTYAQLIPGVNHEVNVSGSTADYGVLILTYAVP
ncbi:MAG: hypothetical protein PHY79_23655, partial [Anaerolineae bacterium]|nr:hypothetical protein [Anaerolineae bacterium]